MSGWNKISLKNFQYIQELYESTFFDDIDKIILSTCTIYGLKPNQIEKMFAFMRNRMIRNVNKIFAGELPETATNKIGIYEITNDLSKITLGQFITIQYYLSRGHIKNAHRIIATIANEPGKKYDGDTQDKRVEYFLTQPTGKVIGTINALAKSFVEFTKQYSNIFGLDDENKSAESHSFNRNYGWIHSATQIAEHNRITLDQAMGLNIRVAFNDLSFLKAKGIYERELLNKK